MGCRARDRIAEHDDGGIGAGAAQRGGDDVGARHEPVAVGVVLVDPHAVETDRRRIFELVDVVVVGPVPDLRVVEAWIDVDPDGSVGFREVVWQLRVGHQVEKAVFIGTPRQVPQNETTVANDGMPSENAGLAPSTPLLGRAGGGEQLGVVVVGGSADLVERLGVRPEDLAAGLLVAVAEPFGDPIVDLVAVEAGRDAGSRSRTGGCRPRPCRAGGGGPPARTSSTRTPAGEVLARQHVQARGGPRATRPRGTGVDRFEHERDPADAALDRDELEVGEAGEHADTQQIGDLDAVVQEQLDRAGGVGRGRTP